MWTGCLNHPFLMVSAKVHMHFYSLQHLVVHWEPGCLLFFGNSSGLGLLPILTFKLSQTIWGPRHIFCPMSGSTVHCQFATNIVKLIHLIGYAKIHSSDALLQRCPCNKVKLGNQTLFSCASWNQRKLSASDELLASELLQNEKDILSNKLVSNYVEICWTPLAAMFAAKTWLVCLKMGNRFKRAKETPSWWQMDISFKIWLFLVPSFWVSAKLWFQKRPLVLSFRLASKNSRAARPRSSTKRASLQSTPSASCK